MRHFTACIASLTIAICWVAACCEGQVNRIPVGARGDTAPASLPFVMTAQDATYTVALPAGWQPAVKPTLEYGLVFGNEGESFAMGMEDVYLDPRMLQSILTGYRAILSPAQLVLKSRMSAPPMGPLDVVTRLLPHLAGGPGGAIQNLNVIRTFRGPEEFGFRQMLVIYQYRLWPQRDPAFASQVHPAVRGQVQVPMRAAAYVVTFPYMPGQFSWTFGYRILSAPQNVFQRNARTYAQIFQSFRVIPEGLRLKVKGNEDMRKLCDSMNQNTHQMAQNWWSDLGPGGEAAVAEAQPTSGTGTAKGAACGVGATYVSCGSGYGKYCCHDQRGPDHYKCVPLSKALPPVVESPTEYGCTRVSD